LQDIITNGNVDIDDLTSEATKIINSYDHERYSERYSYVLYFRYAQLRKKK